MNNLYASSNWVEVQRHGNGQSTWRSPTGDYYRAPTNSFDNKVNGASINRTFHDSFGVRGSTGATSTTSVTARVTQSIPKKSVQSRVFNLGKRVARNPLSKIPYAGAAYTAYELVKEVADLNNYKEDEQGFYRHPEQSEENVDYIMVKHNNYLCTINSQASMEHCCKQTGTVNLGGAQGANCQVRRYRGSPQGLTEAKINFCGSMEINICPGGCYRATVLADGISAVGSCMHKDFYSANFGVHAFPAPKDEKIYMTEADFMNLSEAMIDRAIEKWIEAAEADKPLNWSEPQVMVLSGQTVQSQPYTNAQTGQVEQAKWDFHPDRRVNVGSGQTQVTETITPRPDLTPNSPEAPMVQTPTKTDNSNQNQTQTQQQQQPQNQEDLCEKNPNILACDTLYPTNIPQDELEIPRKEIPLAFNPDNRLPEQGQCPAPVQFQVFGETYQISTQPICEIAIMLRPMLIAMTWLFAMIFCVRAVVKS